MWICVWAGGRAVPRMWAAIGCAYAVNAGMAGLFAIAAWLWLAEALDGSLATRTLLTAPDANVFVDLLMHHGESLRALGVTAAILVALGSLAGIWTNGALVAAAAGDVGVRQSLRRGWGLFPVFLRLWMLAAPTAVAVTGAIGIGGKWLVDWAAGRGLGLPPFAALGGALLAIAASLVVLAAIHDHARIRCAAHPEAGALRSYAWAWRFVWRGGPQALPLAVVLGLAAVLVWSCGLVIRHAISTASEVGVAAGLLLGQLGALARVVARGWSFAAETALQHRHAGADD